MGESEDEGSAEGGRRLPQWPKQKRIRKVLCGDPQAALRSLATFQDADCMQPYYVKRFGPSSWVVLDARTIQLQAPAYPRMKCTCGRITKLVCRIT